MGTRGGKNRFKYEEVKTYIENKGYELLTKEYLDCKTKMQLRCPEGHIFPMDFDGFKNKNSNCPLCQKNLKYKYNEVKEYVEKQGYKLLSKEYKNSRIKLSMECPEGHKCDISFNNFKNIKRRCSVCSRNKKLTLEYVKLEFKKRDYALLETNYVNAITKMKYICNKHKEKGIQETDWYGFSHAKHNCIYCISENSKGSNCCLWKGGTSIFKKHMRNVTKQWREDSIKNCNDKCVLSNKKASDLHHLQGFNLIIKQALNKANLPIYLKVSDYTNEQLKQISAIVLQLHYSYGFGICLSKKLHRLFHNQYSLGDNTPQQFRDFVSRLELGEFDDYLNKNNLTLNINYKLLNELLGGEK